MTDINNLVLDVGGANELTVYTTKVKESLTKKLTVIIPPQSSVNWASGPKTTKIVDLQKIEERFTVDGHIDSTNKNKIKNIFKAGGTCAMSWESESFVVNLDKLEIDKAGSEEQDERPVTFTCVVGENI
jgi:hypothetical protein